MITLAQCITMIETCNAPFVRIYDMYDNPLFSFTEGKDTAGTVGKIKNIAGVLSGYKKINVHAANQGHFNSNWRGCYKWIVVIADDTPVTTKSDTAHTMGWAGIPKDYLPASMLEMQMKHLNEVANIRLEMAKMQFEMANQNKLPIPVEYMPYIGKFLGWSGDEMRELHTMSAATKMAGMPQVHNTLEFQDVQKMSNEEKNTKIDALMTSVATKVSAEQMILLLELIDKRPELVNKALQAAKAGIF